MLLLGRTGEYDVILTEIGVQFHPEYKSTPERPHPLFKGLVAAAIRRRDGKDNSIF
ncbi:MAG: hypothetical protein IJ654_02770 [Bacteroidales bacterium]|nr:hypothetical protein [Bacteroidales bacterium]